jgi:lipoprotein NlpI
MIRKLHTGIFSCIVAAGLTGIRLLSPGPAAAQTQLQPQLESCVNRTNVYSADEQIAGCTAAINSGRQNQQNLVIDYLNRGIAYDHKKEYDRAITDFTKAILLNRNYAIAYSARGLTYDWKGEEDHAMADYDQAIKLNPKDAISYSNRGLLYTRHGENERGIADYNQAIQLDPKFADAYNNRGFFFFLQGATPKALADLTQANALNPKDPVVAIRLEIAIRRSNLASRLAQMAAEIDMTKWPAPVIRLFMDQMTPAAVLAAADDPDATKKKGQVCEANFYSGELSLTKGLKDEATRLFRLAASDCPHSFKEWDAAHAELKALGVVP